MLLEQGDELPKQGAEGVYHMQRRMLSVQGGLR